MARGSCWEGYEQKGMKKKNGRLVPNCVAKMNKGGLKKWFSEKWVDISAPKKGGGYKVCIQIKTWLSKMRACSQSCKNDQRRKEVSYRKETLSPKYWP